MWGARLQKPLRFPRTRRAVQHPPKKRKIEAAVPIGTALANATAVGATKNKIVVTRVTSENAPGRYVRTEERLYYDQTPENMRRIAKSGITVRKIEGKR